MTPYVSIVIACYNEVGLLEQSVAEIREVMGSSRYSYELVFVDDCSHDETVELIKRICDGQTNSRYMVHKRNVGRGGTVADGIRLAQGKVVGFLDIDLEVHARYIPSLVAAIEKGYGAATVTRVYRTSLNPSELLRTVLSVGYRQLVRRMIGVPFADTESGFKFFNRSRILPVLDQAENKGWFWDTEIMALCHRHGVEVKEIPGLFLRRADKVSSVKVFRDTIGYARALRQFRKGRRAA